MGKDEIIFANKLIAEFMGFNYNNRRLVPNGIREFGLKDCRYHSSWDWLMPVVEKIELTIFSICKGNPDIYPSQIKWGQNMFSSHKAFWSSIEISSKNESLNINCYGIDKKEAIYKGVIEFIKWHFQQSK